MVVPIRAVAGPRPSGCVGMREEGFSGAVQLREHAAMRGACSGGLQGPCTCDHRMSLTRARMVVLWGMQRAVRPSGAALHRQRGPELRSRRRPRLVLWRQRHAVPRERELVLAVLAHCILVRVPVGPCSRRRRHIEQAFVKSPPGLERVSGGAGEHRMCHLYPSLQPAKQLGPEHSLAHL